MTTQYTAIGRFEQRKDLYGRRYPVIINNKQEHLVDIHEMIIWTCLNWRILEPAQIESMHAFKSRDITEPMAISHAAYIRRLLQRGLIVSGTGSNGSEALFDLFSNLYIVPLTSSMFVRLVTFVKRTLIDGMPFHVSKAVLKRENYVGCERQIIDLVSQAQLSTAELVKCIEYKANDLSNDKKVLDILYHDDVTTCDNIGSYVKTSHEFSSVLVAVANLYLRRQILFERI